MHKFPSKIVASAIAWLILCVSPSFGAPTVSAVDPAPGSAVGTLSTLSVTFSEPVASVDAFDLFINGETAQSVSGSGAGPYVFTFTQPLPGAVSIEFAGDTSIAAVNGSGPFEAPEPWNYTLADTLPPALLSRAPSPNAVAGALTRAEVVFSEVVTGVDAGDLLVNGVAATAVSGFGAGPYVFTFPAPAFGPVAFTWKPGHGIVDLAGNAFADPGWSVTRAAAGAGGLVITEFAAINSSSTFLDEDGDNEGWIEIFNPGTSAVDLTGWALTDDADVPRKWLFPGRTLAAGGYLVVFASGKDRRGAGELHANFKLGVNSGYLALFKPDLPAAKATEFVDYPGQRAGYSYGVVGGATRYFSAPSPAAANPASSLSALAATPVPGTGRGFFSAPFSLTLGTPTAGATIRYTTDGSEPTESTGTVYSAPIAINSTTVIRAAAFAPGLVPSATLTSSYIFLAKVIDQPDAPAGFPTNWGTSSEISGGVVPADYGMDRDPLRVTPTNSASAIDATKLQRLNDGLRELPSMSIVIPNRDMFAPTGMYHSSHVTDKDFPDKLCSVEMILPDGTTAFATTSGLATHGNASREPAKNPKHGFGLKFKPEFGPSKLEYRLFPESAVEEYDDLILRPEFNSSWRHWSNTGGNSLGAYQRTRASLIRDMWMKDTMLEMGNVACHSRLVHLFINGLYFGIYDISEDPSSAFAENFLGGQKTDYDVYDQGVLKEGTADAYTAMTNLPTATTNAIYEQYKQYLDLPAFIDYTLLHFYAGHQDWGKNKNWSAIRQRAGGTFTTEGKFRYVPWDGECVLLGTTVKRIPNAGGSTDLPSGLHPKLDDNAQYRLDFADRAQRFLVTPGGALTVEKNVARWQKWQAILDKPVVAESCRWGDYRRDVHRYSEGTYELYTREDHWMPENTRVIETYFPTRAGLILDQLRESGLYPTLNAPEFRLASGGSAIGSGQIAPGTPIALALPTATAGTTSAGTIYYTTDGTDPRVIYSGALGGGAQAYGQPFAVSSTTTLKARALNAGTWSALTEVTLATDSAPPLVRITELMYNPAGGGELEFVELFNAGPLTVDLNGWSFTGINYVFPPGSLIGPGSRLIIAINDAPATWRTKYPGVTPYAYYGGSLSNSGETVALRNAAGVVISSVTYADKSPWPTSPDGGGYSLEIVDPLGDANDPANWRASKTLGGTPGSLNSATPAPVITLDPQDQTILQGTPVTFTAAASGAGLKYQWRFENADLPGETSASFTLNAVTPAYEGAYRCVISNPGGAATTNPAVLTVSQTFAQWIATTGLSGLDAGASADPDADGVMNIAEFYHHLDPRVASTEAERAALPALSTDGSDLSLTYRVNPRAHVGVSFEQSSDLHPASWTTVNPSSSENLAPDAATGDARVRMKFSLPPATTRAFLRMQLTP